MRKKVFSLLLVLNCNPLGFRERERERPKKLQELCNTILHFLFEIAIYSNVFTRADWAG